MMYLVFVVAVLVALMWVAWQLFCNRPASSAQLGVPTAGRMANPVPGLWWR